MGKWFRPRNWLIGLIRLYQRHISSRTAAACRFTPTCSAYAVEAIDRFGAVRGGVLALWRVLRCHPLCRGGYDPVPERFPRPWRKERRR